VVVINADKIRLTGNKVEQKIYYSHSGIRRAEGSSGEEVAAAEGGLDGARGGSRDAAEEQTACAARKEAARVPGCDGIGAARGAKAAGSGGLAI